MDHTSPPELAFLVWRWCGFVASGDWWRMVAREGDCREQNGPGCLPRCTTCMFAQAFRAIRLAILVTRAPFPRNP